MSGSWPGNPLLSLGMFQTAVASMTFAHPIDATGAIAYPVIPFGAGSPAGGFLFSTSYPQMQTS
jgi:hypothetical protein